MALHTLGTNSSTSLPCTNKIVTWPPIQGGNPSPQDIAAIDFCISDDGGFGTIGVGSGSGTPGIGVSFGVQNVLATGTTHGTTSITSVVANAGSPPIGQIQNGDAVLGIGITPGTFVAGIASGGATITLSQACASNTTGVNLAFVRLSEAVEPGAGFDVSSGRLWVPSRGVLQVFPGDVVAIDNIGWPILVSGQAIAYTGSQWTFT